MPINVGWAESSRPTGPSGILRLDASDGPRRRGPPYKTRPTLQVLSQEAAQVIHREPLRVVVAGEAEAVGQGPGVLPVPRRDVRMVGPQDEQLAQLDALPRLVLVDQDLVKLLAGADADVANLAPGGDRFHQVDDLHARDLRHEDFAAVHHVQA